MVLVIIIFPRFFLALRSSRLCACNAPDGRGRERVEADASDSAEDLGPHAYPGDGDFRRETSYEVLHFGLKAHLVVDDFARERLWRGKPIRLGNECPDRAHQSRSRDRYLKQRLLKLDGRQVECRYRGLQRVS